MFDEPQIDPRDVPSAEEVEKARARVFTMPIEGLTPAAQRQTIGAVLGLRNMVRRVGMPASFAWPILNFILAKLAEVALSGAPDRDKAIWVAVVAVLRQLFTGEPSEEAIDRIIRETSDPTPGDTLAQLGRHIVALMFSKAIDWKQEGKSRAEAKAGLRQHVANIGPTEEGAAQFNGMAAAVVREVYGPENEERSTDE